MSVKLLHLLQKEQQKHQPPEVIVGEVLCQINLDMSLEIEVLHGFFHWILNHLLFEVLAIIFKAKKMYQRPVPQSYYKLVIK